jgi:hypothetical protein
MTEESRAKRLYGIEVTSSSLLLLHICLILHL